MATYKVTTSREVRRYCNPQTQKPLPPVFKKSFGGTIWKTIKYNPCYVLLTKNIKGLCYNRNTFVDYKMGTESCNDSLKLSSINASLGKMRTTH